MTSLESVEVDLHGARVTVALHTRFDRQFWTRWMPAGWEADTFEFVRRNVAPGSVFLDIGAWIGPIGLYAASLGARVIALEPDPVSIVSLRDNARLNQGLPGSLEVLHTAFSAQPGEVRIFGNHKGFGTSGSSSIERGWRSIRIDATTAGDLIARVGDDRPVVMKVDIEAHEYFCASELSRLRRELDATMYMSIHPFLLRKSMRWRRLTGTADGEMLRRTEGLLAAFDDCDLTFAHLDGVAAREALAGLLTADGGPGVDLTLVARSRTMP